MKFRNIFSLIFISFLTLVVLGAVADDDASDEAIDFCNLDGFSASQINEIRGNSVGSIKDVGFDFEIFTDSEYNVFSSNYVFLYKAGSLNYYFSYCNNKCFFTYGLSFDGTKTHKRIGHLYADYKASVSYVYNEEYTYIGIHGWGRDSDNSLIEYYIVDSWSNYYEKNIWDDKENLMKHGSITIDGAEYNVYQINDVKTDENSDTTHTQIFSVRKISRDCGTIDITEHLRQWEEFGIKLGIINDAKFIIESKGISDEVMAGGGIRFYYAKIYIKPIKHKCII